MRLTFALIVFAWASGLIAQESSGYIETNVGVSYTNAEVDYFPGISFLYGRRMFLSNTSFWDAQIGLAAPSVATTKVGWGYRSAASDFSVSTGVRIWPAHVYLQFGIPDKRCSNELSDRMQRRLDRREGRIRMTWCVENGRCLWRVDWVEPGGKISALSQLQSPPSAIDGTLSKEFT